MDILIQSLLEQAKKFNASMRIRYFARSKPEAVPAAPQNHVASSDAAGGCVGMTSYVIIRREYSYLEPLVRSMFEEAEDVKVLIDRRAEKGPEPLPSFVEGERRGVTDRRTSTPMLDILINVES